MNYEVISGIPIWGVQDCKKTLHQIMECKVDAVRLALMADHHLGYSVPIGGVVAYDNQIAPAAVGYDIACGNKAVELDIYDGDLGELGLIMDDIFRDLAFGVGKSNQYRVEHELFDDDPAWGIPIVKELKQKAEAQLGTIGSGNHYVDIFSSRDTGRIWVGVHFGSRGFGWKIAQFFMKEAGERRGVSKPALLDLDSETGQEYFAAMKLAGRYAYAGRDWVCDYVADLIGAPILQEVHNHHNFAWVEDVDGKDLVVIRKGATPARPGQKGFVGASMGEDSVILEGVESEESRLALYSTVHGAGRKMSRTRAKKEISKDAWKAWIDGAGVRLRGGGLDEAPQAYKRLSDVLQFHSNTIRVLETLQPLGVAMAGSKRGY